MMKSGKLINRCWDIINQGENDKGQTILGNLKRVLMWFNPLISQCTENSDNIGEHLSLMVSVELDGRLGA